MKQHDIQVRKVSVYSVEQHPRNPHNGDVDLIAESIRANGFIDPLFVQRSTRYIIAGNHRYAAAIQLGIDEVPIIELDMDDREALRYMLASNRTSQAGWDDEAGIADLLSDLYATDAGLPGTGYSFEDYISLQTLLDQPLSPEDFGEDAGKPLISPEIQADLRRHLKYELVPTVSEDGKPYSVTIRKDNGRSITLNEFNMLRKALGQDPITASEADRYRVPSWEE